MLRKSKKRCPPDYDTLSTDALEQLLRADLDDPDGMDPDALLPILETLAMRDPMPPDVAPRAWRSFEENYLPAQGAAPVKPCKRIAAQLRKPLAACIALVLLLNIALCTTASKGGEPWSQGTPWETDSLSFSDLETTPNRVPDTEPYPDPTGICAPLYQSVEEHGGSCGPLPTWVPDRFSFHSLRYDPAFQCHTLVYQYNGIHLNISVQSPVTDAICYHEIGDLIEIYERDGVDHFIFVDGDYAMVFWLGEVGRYYFCGVLTPSEVKTMIDSIERK